MGVRVERWLRSADTNPSLCIQMVQLGAWYIVQSTQNEICMAAGQYPDQTSGTFIVNRQASQVIMVWPCLPSRNRTIIIQGKVDGGRRTGRPRKSWTAASRNGHRRRLVQVTEAGHRQRYKVINLHESCKSRKQAIVQYYKKRRNRFSMSRLIGGNYLT